MNKEKLGSYDLVQEEDLADVHARGSILRHKKTGARVMLIENDDENKVFCIAFRTPSRDSTGAAHILEHSVLCGSREFPLKDPFVELVKGSLNTFLNAITYPDKTCFPVASCNDQDFRNLMHVYLDAVFYPRIYEQEEIFRQEGWNYHLESAEGPLSYNGVVYNEMKGAFSSPDDVLEREVLNQLFPDTSYGFESGGDPKDIPSLTYEKFLDFHKTYYHPSNCFIYLYGNMDMAEHLAFIDEHYLSHFDKKQIDSEVHYQDPFRKIRQAVKEYPVTENEGEEGNTYLSYSVVPSKDGDICRDTAFSVLDYALLSSSGAPLKKALQDAGIGTDIYGYYDGSLLQPVFSIIAKGSDAHKKEEFCAVIRQVLETCVRDGIDPKSIEAALNSFEFSYREADFGAHPKGLMYGLHILDNWIYTDENPFRELKMLSVFETLRKAAGSGYYEELLKKEILDNPHGCVLSLVPSMGLAGRMEEELAESLEQYRQSLTEEERQQLVMKTQALAAYQEEEDAPGAAECIPLLKRSDIRPDIQPLCNELLSFSGNDFLYHDVCTNGIAYVSLLFRFDSRDADKLHYLSLLRAVLGDVDTESYTYSELDNEINIHCGGIGTVAEVYDNTREEDSFRVFFNIHARALYDKLDFVFGMFREILLTSRLDDEKRLKEILGEIRMELMTTLQQSGNATALRRALSYGSLMAKAQDEMSGIGFYQFVEDLVLHFDAKKQEIKENLKKVLQEILDPSIFMVNYTGERSSLEKVMSLAEDFKKNLSAHSREEDSSRIRIEKKNEGFKTSGQVQFVAQAGNFSKKGFSYTGALEILRTILSYDYLWMNLRVKGGAYGCGSMFRRNGTGCFTSYRDPHLSRTLEIYKGIPEYIRSFTADERQMTKYIIGTISSLDTPRTPKMQGSISGAAYLRGITEKMIQEQRDEILKATQEDIRALAPIVEAILSDEQICVVGSASAIEAAENVFMETKYLVKD